LSESLRRPNARSGSATFATAEPPLSPEFQVLITHRLVAWNNHDGWSKITGTLESRCVVSPKKFRSSIIHARFSSAGLFPSTLPTFIGEGRLLNKQACLLDLSTHRRCIPRISQLSRTCLLNYYLCYHSEPTYLASRVHVPRTSRSPSLLNYGLHLDSPFHS